MTTYLIVDGQLAGLADSMDTSNLPTGDWQIVESDLGDSPALQSLYWDGVDIRVRSQEDSIGCVRVLEPAPEATNPFATSELFTQARVAARDNLAVQTELAVALFAANQGDGELLATAVVALEDLLTAPSDTLEVETSQDAPNGSQPEP